MLERFGVEHTVAVMSAHKTPDVAIGFAKAAADDGYAIIIAGAGKAAHLAGVMAGCSHLPVIGVPLSATLDGMDALLATVQMPTGIPVATVAIDGAANARAAGCSDPGAQRPGPCIKGGRLSQRTRREDAPGLK